MFTKDARPEFPDLEPERETDLAALTSLSLALSRAVEILTTAQHSNVAGGVDFYEEVARFEAGLIKRALREARGNQTRAARLLNLKQTTLHGKIKHYKIYPTFLIYGDVQSPAAEASTDAQQDRSRRIS